MKKTWLSLILLLASTIYSTAQTTKQVESIETQFQELFVSSNNYKNYKIFKTHDFLELQKNTLQRIGTIQQEVDRVALLLQQQKDSVANLTLKNNDLQARLSTSIAREGSIAVFGKELSKTLYNILLWSFILVLTSGLGFFFYQYKNANLHTKKAEGLLLETEKSFEAHKKKTMDTAQKLRRQLQDEVNKRRGI